MITFAFSTCSTINCDKVSLLLFSSAVLTLDMVLANSAASTTVTQVSNLAKSGYKMGYQLFSIRDEMAKDPLATLRALKAMGYEDFEIYGYDAETNKIYGYDPKEFKIILLEDQFPKIKKP